MIKSRSCDYNNVEKFSTFLLDKQNFQNMFQHFSQKFSTVTKFSTLKIVIKWVFVIFCYNKN